MVTNGKKTCRDVPFRDVAHAIAAYALNQSSMYVQIPCPPPPPPLPYQPGPPPPFLEFMVPSEWFRHMGMAMSVKINALPRDAWEALQLHTTQPLGINASIGAIFDKVIDDTTTKYLQETVASWPWTPPPPAPPPTPPPCPGGSLQVWLALAVGPLPTSSAACSLPPSPPLPPPPSLPLTRQPASPYPGAVLRAEPCKHVLRRRRASIRARDCRRSPTKSA